MRCQLNAGFRGTQMSEGITALLAVPHPTAAARGRECYVDSGGRFPQGGTIDTDEKKLADGARQDGEGQQTRVAARVKEKALGPCELRALLRDEPSSPCTRHGRRRITGHRQTLRSNSTRYARALDRAHNLSRLRDEIETSDHFKGG